MMASLVFWTLTCLQCPLPCHHYRGDYTCLSYSPPNIIILKMIVTINKNIFMKVMMTFRDVWQKSPMQRGFFLTLGLACCHICRLGISWLVLKIFLNSQNIFWPVVRSAALVFLDRGLKYFLILKIFLEIFSGLSSHLPPWYFLISVWNIS